MINLLTETIQEIEANGHKTTDVLWVGSDNGEYAIDWQRFSEIANVEYYDSYGSQVIAGELIIVGMDWWMERHEYDGSEWWEFKKLPIRLIDAKPFSNVVCRYIGDEER